MNKNQKKWLIISIVIIIILALGLGLGLGLGLKKKDTRDDFSEIFDSTKINIPLDKRCIDSSFKGTSDPDHEQGECSITFKIIPKCKNVLTQMTDNKKIKKDVIIYSPGGVACTTIFDSILESNTILLNDKGDKDGLKHLPVPQNGIAKKAIYIMNDPLLAVLSHYRRGWANTQMEKLKNYKYKDYSLEKLLKTTETENRDLFGIETQFNNFIQSNVDYPIMFVYFKNISKNKKKICTFLDVKPDTFDNFQIIERNCKKDKISSKVLKIYEKLNQKFLDYDTYILKPSFL